MQNKFYVYEWYDENTDEIVYVGKGSNKRYCSTLHRNIFFKNYIKHHKCNSRIVKGFETEEEAFEYEKELVNKYFSMGQAFLNIAHGGGAKHSLTNKGKASLMQRAHSEENKKNMENMRRLAALKTSRAVIIDGVLYNSCREAARALNVSDRTISNWCKRGRSGKGVLCKYVDEEQKITPLKITNSRRIIIGGEEYSSVRKAAQALDTWPETIIRAIKRNGKFNGMTCKYVNQQPSYTNSDFSSVEGSTTNE